MNVPSIPPAKSPLFPCSRRAAIAFLAFAAILPPTFSPAATAAPQASTLVTLASSAALRTLFQTIMATFNSDLTLHSQNLETSGDLAYDSGDFQETLTTIATGAKITAKGSYIIIFKRQPNGSWQIVQHAWTGTPPPGTQGFKRVSARNRR